MDYFLIWLFPAVLVGGLGLFLVLTTTAHIRRCEAVSTWQKTTGSVEKAAVERFKTRRANPVYRTAYRTVRYAPLIEYSYFVNNLPYNSTEFQNFNGVYASNTREEAEEIVSEYPVGKKVEVTYNPELPSEAYLRPAVSTERLLKMRRTQSLALIVAAVWFALGTFLMISEQFASKAAFRQLETSAGLLPIAADQLQPALDELAQSQQLTCNTETAAGTQMVYTLQTCAGAGLTRLEVYTRRDDAQKVDLISAYLPTATDEETLLLLQQTTNLVFSGSDAATLNDWLADSLNAVQQSGGRAETEIGGVPATLDNLGAALRLNLGNLN